MVNNSHQRQQSEQSPLNSDGTQFHQYQQNKQSLLSSDGQQFHQYQQIKVITKLPNSEQSYKGKVKTHNYINRQNQSTTGKL
jgi:hypothetical protein